MSKIKTSAEIREAFLSYFESEGHARIASSSLVPGNDPTLLFTNAGMVQFKDVFLGDDPRSYQRATSSQRCVRAGGKHNDLENVGYTARHHTFFEMLGNFSFGDYFKQQAIPFAWHFLTETLSIPIEKLWVTVYAEDDEAFDIWHHSIGLPKERIIRIGDNKGARYASDNFWSMGDTGPCGPCTEIFYDHGAHIEGGLPGTPEEDGDRYIEIWNIVFMQFNRSADGDMANLPKPSVDTGMGLERIAAIMQGVHSNYEIDIFQNLLAAIANILSVKDKGQGSLRVIADHIRSCAFLIGDGVMPSNEGRGYVLRRIIRRAVRHGNQLGATELFFYKLVQPLIVEMGNAYPELVEQQNSIERALKAEEEQFALTLDQGIKILDQAIQNLSDKVIPGKIAFKLYDTYGFPLDLTADIARERGLSVDNAGYEEAMAQQRAQAKAASQFKAGGYKLDIQASGAERCTQFTGYETLTAVGNVQALFVEGEPVEKLAMGMQGIALVNATPFYAESGGQAGDKGLLKTEQGVFQVEDTQKQGDTFLHSGKMLEGSLGTGEQANLQVDQNFRQATALNHSATHLLHAALRKVLGEHVTQKGSLVDAKHLRFDFSHHEALTQAQLSEITVLVNQEIRANTTVDIQITDMEGAKQLGAMALFGEKYGEQVRVLSMGSNQFSVELCGGTHVERTGDIGLLRIVSESGIASGVRRIEAVTGEAALAAIGHQDTVVAKASNMLKASSDNFLDKLQQILAEQKLLEKKIQQFEQKMASNVGSDLATQAEDIAGKKLLVATLSGVKAKSLRDTVDQLKQKLDSAVIILAATEGEKIALVAGVTDDLVKVIKAGDIIKVLAADLGGKGGGKPSFAQGGGSDVSKLDAALKKAKEDIKAVL